MESSPNHRILQPPYPSFLHYLIRSTKVSGKILVLGKAIVWKLENGGFVIEMKGGLKVARRPIPQSAIDIEQIAVIVENAGVTGRAGFAHGKSAGLKEFGAPVERIRERAHLVSWGVAHKKSRAAWDRPWSFLR
jgi:hypothetical protein